MTPTPTELGATGLSSPKNESDSSQGCYLLCSHEGTRSITKVIKERRGNRSKNAYSYNSECFLRPARSRIRRTFFGEIDRRVATRETLRPSRSHTFGITSSANSSATCWNVLSPSDP